MTDWTWKCDRCGHEWTRIIGERVKSCPGCGKESIEAPPPKQVWEDDDDDTIFDGAD